MFGKILVPLDGSPEAEVALPIAIELAARFEAAITLIEVNPEYPHIVAASVAESFGASGSVAAQAEASEAAETAASAYLQTVRERFGTPQWGAVVADGRTGEAIVQYADGWAAELIVMAT